MNIRIAETSDSYSCETCGSSWATGFNIYFDNVLTVVMKPVAHCMGGDDFTIEDALKAALEELGHTLSLP
jgi:hypothetical protein